jgi:MFS family permease
MEHKERERLIVGISTNIIFLGVVSFFTDISTEIIVAVLPTFLVFQLGATPEIVGGIEGAAESVTSFLRLLSGAIADKTGKRKGITLVGYSLSNLVKPFMGFVGNWGQVLGLRMTDRVGKGLRTPPRDAMIADSTAEKKMGRAFGIHRTLDQIGAIVGPVLAFLLFVPLGYQGIFLFTAIPGAIAVLVLFVFVKEPPRRSNASSISLRNARSLLNRPFSMYLGSATLYAVAAISYAFILLRAVELGVPKEVAPLVYAGIQVFHVFASLPAGEISDRFGRVRAIQLGYLFLLLSFVVIALAPNAWVLVLGVVLYGGHQGIVETSQRAIIPSLITEEYRGTAYGIYNTLIGIVTFPTNLFAGFLFTVNSAYAFYYGAAFAVLASLAMAITQRQIGRGK